jgi:hypothetical protein
MNLKGDSSPSECEDSPFLFVCHVFVWRWFSLRWGSFQHAFFGSSYKCYDLGMFRILHDWIDDWTYPRFELSFKTLQSWTGHFHILLELIKLGLRSLSSRYFPFHTYTTNKSEGILRTLQKMMNTMTWMLLAPQLKSPFQSTWLAWTI